MNNRIRLMNKAWQFATTKHGDQMYGDKPYSYHLQSVVNNVGNRIKPDHEKFHIYVAVAWLHDTIEDTEAYYEEVEHLFGSEIADAVQLLTKQVGVSYEDYLRAIIQNEVAREVKICDTMANLVESFLSGNTRGMNKYPRQLEILVKGEI